MFNPNQVSAQLSRLPDAALQQYAEMHKTDPYVMALAMSESNRRKQLRMAATPAAQQGEPPKVVDQQLAQMAPPPAEGIAALPADNMAAMADGGIVGYADRGEVRWADVREGSDIAPGGRWPGTPRDRRLYAAGAEPERRADRPAAAATDELPYDPYDPALLGQPPSTGGEGSVWGRIKDAFLYNSDVEAMKARAAGAPQVSEAPPVPTAAPVEVKPAGIAAITAKQGPAGEPRRAAPSAGASKKTTKSSTASAASPANPDIPDDAAKSKDALLALIDQRNKVSDPEVSFDERKAEIARKQGALDARSKDNVSDALIAAGLAMMAGDSPYAAVNIGKGGLMGLKAYKDGKKDIYDLENDISKHRVAMEEAINANNMAKAERERKKLDPLIQLQQNIYSADRAFGDKLRTGKVEHAQKLEEIEAQGKNQVRVAGIYAGARAGGAGSLAKTEQAWLVNQQKNLASQLAKLPPFGADEQRAEIQAQLDAVNAEMQRRAVPGTAAPTPAGPRAKPLTSFGG